MLGPSTRVIPVLIDTDTLIMSPALFAQRPILKPGDLEGHTLLASETRAGDWADWLEAAGLQHLAGLPRQIFDHFFVTRQAVEDGLGIGIGPLPMLEIDIASGRLMAPLPDIRVSRAGYVAIIPRQGTAGTPAVGFVDWLASQAPGMSG
jgi:LysR family glycine cleavage system transcriptional activator